MRLPHEYKMAATFAKHAKCFNTWNTKMLLTSIRLCSFRALGINEVLVERLENSGIKQPSKIQEKALPAVLKGRNAIINAETGSGKTLCYLLPIINNLMKNPILLDKPPYAIILLPTIELCNQVATVFKSLAEPHMHPCIVHRDSKLLVATSYPVVMAMPSALLSYNMDSLNNVSMVVTDEADFLTTSGGKDVWKVLDFLKHGKHLKKTGYGTKKSGVNQSSNKKIVPNSVPDRQFIFAAATLPSRGKKASLNVLSKWIPSAEILTSSIVHQKLPTLDVLNVNITEDLKLSQLLLTLNQLASLVKEENTKNLTEKTNRNDKCNREVLESNGKVEIKNNNFDNWSKSYNGEAEIITNENVVSERRGLGLRIMVFTNTAQQASKAFQYLTHDQSDDRNSEIDTTDDHVLDNKHKKTQKYSQDTSYEHLDRFLNSNIDGSDFENEGEHSIANKEVEGRHYWKNKCAQLHKDVPIKKRLESLEKFKSGELEVLVCTDIASRGLDIANITHVIQLDFASNAATFLHRTGRTARAGSTGKVINFITPKDEDLARALRACDDSSSDGNYEAAFSRNRMFRRRVKTKTLPLADSV